MLRRQLLDIGKSIVVIPVFHSPGCTQHKFPSIALSTILFATNQDKYHNDDSRLTCQVHKQTILEVWEYR